MFVAFVNHRKHFYFLGLSPLSARNFKKAQNLSPQRLRLETVGSIGLKFDGVLGGIPRVHRKKNFFDPTIIKNFERFFRERGISVISLLWR